MADSDSLCLHDLVLAQVARTPDAVAVQAGTETVTFAELAKRSARLANHLRELGVGTDTPVAVCAERGVDMVVCLLAAQLAGGAYVPLDPDHPRERLGYLLTDVRAPVVLTQRRLSDRLPATDATVCRIDGDTGIAGRPPLAPSGAATADSLAYLIYTSGSTGWPKGVCVPHRAIVNRIRWMQDEYSLDATDVVLQKTPFGFDVSVWEFFWPLMTGARLVMARSGGHRDPAYLAEAIDRYRVTTLHFVPTMLAEFLAYTGGREFAGVRRVICSGEALPRTVAERAARAFPGGIHNLYGPTEAAVDVSHHRFVPGAGTGGVPIGVPISNVTLHVLDGALRERPAGEAGELYIGGVGLARGYHGRPRLTAERFIPDPAGGGRLYRTGDQVRRLPGGELEFLGRLDDQVKINGNRIELGEVEQALLDHADVTGAAVAVRAAPAPGMTAHGTRDADGAAAVGGTDGAAGTSSKDGTAAAGGTERRWLVGYVTVRNPGRPSAAELRAHLAGRLPDYMVPARIVRLDRLPVTASGKVDRAALPEPADAGDRALPPVAPRTTVEERLAQAWSQVLGPGPVGIHDDFFAAGGDSVLAIRLVAQAGAAGVAVTTRDVFEHPSIADLAAHASTVMPTGPDTVRDGQVPFGDCPLGDREIRLLRERYPDAEDAYALTPLQEGMLFHWLLEPDAADYLQQHVYGLDGPVRVDDLAAAWRACLARHPVLRSTVVWDGVAEPVQVVHAAPVAQVRSRDGGTDDGEAGTAERDWGDDGRLGAVLAAERRQGFDLAAAPPVRVTLFRRGPARTDMVLTFHHILLDGWSVSVLLREVLAAYRGDGGRPAPVVPFRRYVSWLAGRDRGAARAYWRDLLRGWRAPTPPPATVDTAAYAGTGQVVQPVPDAVAAGISAMARRERLTVHTVTAGAWATWLAGHGGIDDVVFGVTVAGRPPQVTDVERMIGLLVNTIPLRVRFAGDRPYLSMLRGIQRQQVASREFESTPLPEIAAASGLPPRTALFESIFVFQNHPPLPHGTAGDRPRLDTVRIVESTGYPLTLVVETQPRLALRLLFRRDLLDERSARTVLADLTRLLRFVLEDPAVDTASVLSGRHAGTAAG